MSEQKLTELAPASNPRKARVSRQNRAPGDLGRLGATCTGPDPARPGKWSEAAHLKSQKYKEGKFVLERGRIVDGVDSEFYINTNLNGSDPDD
ncbi:uncharacterized protein A4U43_C07F38300 [Asparagus officinalis]|uniref:Uncharacterized protein n=1 Tax=Asparagus officinalis TaxID=4686 RepID=A0A5P1EHZ1_ASPOF|nr:uncharacterized protein A4U43_C07F38300 [Asparagus officinalis]